MLVPFWNDCCDIRSLLPEDGKEIRYELASPDDVHDLNGRQEAKPFDIALPGQNCEDGLFIKISLCFLHIQFQYVIFRADVLTPCL